MTGIEDLDARAAGAYLALGRYVSEFSLLCQNMRFMTAQVMNATGPSFTTIQLLTADMTAGPLVDGCLALWEHQCGNDDQVKVVRALRAELRRTVERRNDVMHGDWWIGWLTSTGTEQGEPVYRDLPPTLSRTKPGRSGSEKTHREELQVEELEATADRVREVRRTMEDIGTALAGRAFIVPPPAEELLAAPLEMLYEVKDGRLSRTGPLASASPPHRML